MLLKNYNVYITQTTFWRATVCLVHIVSEKKASGKVEVYY